jgi:hypothetical protein
MGRKVALKAKEELRKHINGTFKNVHSAERLYLKTTKGQEAEIQGLLHPAEASHGYFLAWFQSLHLPSTQSESPLWLLNATYLLKVCTQLRIELFIFHIAIGIIDYPTSGLTVTG